MSLTAILDRLATLENPYPGLRPFETDDAHLFFGRDRHTAELAALLDRNHFVAVVGVSGSGKSSLVRAGLIPALQRGHIRESRVHWRIVVARPGRAPFTSLTAALEECGLDPAPLTKSSHGLIEVARQLGPDESLLVIIDQFEEIFRYRDAQPVTQLGSKLRAQQAAAAAEFVQLLLAASRHHPPIYVVVTMRSDYLGDCAEFRDLPETLNESTYLIPRLTRQERKEAIEGPLGRVDISPSLVQRMLNDVGDDPEQLPILQHALMRTWNRWHTDDPHQQRGLELRDYEAIGGFHGALNQHCNELLKTLDEPTVATIFRRLTARARGDRERRDPARLLDLWALCGAVTPAARKAVNDTLDCLRQGDATFITPRAEPLEDDTDIDITHESLIRLWVKLRDEWLPAEHKSAKTFLELAERAKSWKKDPQRELLRGLDLSEALRWDVERNQTAAWARHYADDDTLAEVEEYLAASRKAEEWREGSNRRIVILVSAAAILFALLGTGAAFQWRAAAALRTTAEQRRVEAEGQRSEADTQRIEAVAQRTRAVQLRDIAEAAARDAERAQGETVKALEEANLLREAAVAARNEFLSWQSSGLAGVLAAHSYAAMASGERDLGLLLAVEAVRRDADLSTDRAIRLAMADVPRTVARVPHDDGVYVRTIAFGPNSQSVISGGDDGTVRMLSLKGTDIWRFESSDDVNRVSVSRDGRIAASAHDDGSVRLFDAGSGRQLATVEHAQSVDAVTFSPDSRTVATGGDDGIVRLSDAATGRQLWRLETDGAVRAVGFSGDGTLLAAGLSNDAALVIDAGSGKEVNRLTHGDSVIAVAFAPSGDRLATGSDDDAVRVFEAGTGTLLWTRPTGDDVYAVTFSPDGGRVLAGSDDSTARLYEAAAGTELLLVNHDDWVRAVQFSPDGRTFVTGSDDGTARVIDSRSGRELSRVTHDDYVRTVSFSADGRYLASGSDDGLVMIVEPRSEELSRFVLEDAFSGGTVGNSSGGAQLAIVSDGTVEIIDTETRRTTARFPLPDVTELEVSADGRWALVADGDGNGARLYSTDGRLRATIAAGGSVRDAVFTPDGRWLAVGSGEELRVLETATAREVLRLPVGVDSLALTPDGARLVVASTEDDTDALLFDVASQREIGRFVHEEAVIAVGISADGRLVATSSRDDHARVFEVGTTRSITLDLRGNHRIVTFSPDAREVATAVGDSVRVFATATGEERARLQFPLEQVADLAHEGTSLRVTSGSALGETLQIVVRRHLRNPQDLIEAACARVSRNLTPDEWKKYAGPDEPYRRTCTAVE